MNRPSLEVHLNVSPAAAALPMACRVERPLLPSRLRAAAVAELAEPETKPSEDEEDDDMDWLSIFCSTRTSSTSTSL